MKVAYSLHSINYNVGLHNIHVHIHTRNKNGKQLKVIIVIINNSFGCFRVKVRPLSLTPHMIMIVKVMMTPMTFATLNLQSLMIPMTTHSNMK